MSNLRFKTTCQVFPSGPAYIEKINWDNLTHLMSLALVPKNTHIEESN